MEELFTNVPDYIKQLTECWVKLALQQDDIRSAVKMITDFISSLPDESYSEFVDFYFNMQLELKKNESNND